MNPLCTWCEAAFEPRRNGGSVQRFCSKNCRQDFNTACRVWAAQEYEAERLSIFTLRSCLEQHTRCVERDPASASPPPRAAPADTEPSPVSPQGRLTSMEVDHGCLS